MACLHAVAFMLSLGFEGWLSESVKVLTGRPHAFVG